MKVKVLAAQSSLTLFDSMDCSLPGSSVHGILQARIQEWVAISFSIHYIIVFIYFFNVYFYFILLYNTVLVLPYINMNPPRVYVSSQS